MKIKDFVFLVTISFGISLAGIKLDIPESVTFFGCLLFGFLYGHFNIKNN